MCSFKNTLVKDITKMVTSEQDCVIFKLKMMPALTFISYCFALSDSLFCNEDVASPIQEVLPKHTHEDVVIIGDFSACFGARRKELEKNLPPGWSYADRYTSSACV